MKFKYDVFLSRPGGDVLQSFMENGSNDGNVHIELHDVSYDDCVTLQRIAVENDCDILLRTIFPVSEDEHEN